MNGFIAMPIVTFFSAHINKIIIFLFGFNFIIFIIILLLCRSLKRYMEEKNVPEMARQDPDKPGETYISRLKRTYNDWGKRYRYINPWVHYYSILTTIFPLLGILGTVCALLQVSSDFSDVQGNFLIALSSTFWGLVAAIVSKAGEGLFSPDVDRFKVIYEIFTKDIIELEKSRIVPDRGAKQKEPGLKFDW